MTKKINPASTDSIKNFLEFGKITNTHGLNGEIFVPLFSTDIELSLIQNQVVQLKRNTNIYLETSIEKARFHKNGLIIKLQKVNSLKQAEKLKGTALFIPKQIFSSLKGENIYLCEILNFIVEDKTRGNVGKIFAFSNNRSQDLLLIKNKKDRQVEIPFIEHFIIHIDFEMEKIQVDLPLNWPNLDFS